MTPGERRHFGTLPDGRVVERLVIGTPDLQAAVLTMGAILQDVRVPDAAHSLTLGSDSLDAYHSDGPLRFFGAVVGPVANRVAEARFAIDGQNFQIAANEGPNCLHSGPTGTHGHVWQVARHDKTALVLTLDLADGLGGFPGNRHLEAHFAVQDGTLRLTLTATTDAPTALNLANHSYWNLNGANDIDTHTLAVMADRMLPVTEASIPTGEAAPVAGTRFDLRAGRVLSDGQRDAFDHNFCLTDGPGEMRVAARLTAPDGRMLEMATTDPGLQVYTADRMDTGDHLGHGGVPYGARAGVAMEAQGWPDAPNQPSFPPVALAPGETYSQVTEWRFRAPSDAD